MALNTIDLGDLVKLTNEAGIVLIGSVSDLYEHGGSSLVQINLSGTTSTIEVDLGDFEIERHYNLAVESDRQEWLDKG